MIHLDISILYQIILFLIVWVILSKVLFQPYLRLLEERERRTTGAQHDSADLELEGARLKAQYEEQLNQARNAANAAREAIIQEGRQQREKILLDARAEAAHSLDSVRKDVAAALEQERRLGVAEATTIGAEMASKVLGRRVA